MKFSRMKSTFWSIGIVIPTVCLALGCGDTQSAKAQTTDDTNKQVATAALEKNQVSNLIETNCYVCHNPKSTSHDDMLAPPLAGIKMRYLGATEGREAFIDQMTTFVSNPNEEASLMKGPIRRFGLMPKTALSTEEIRKIVTFIHDNEIPAPTWFAQHEREMHGKNKQ